MKRRWTKAEEALLRQLWDSPASGKQLGTLFHRDFANIAQHGREKMGLPTRSKAKAVAASKLIKEITGKQV